MFDRFENVVLQPTTVCNLDCSYCYLPARHLSLRMGIEIAEAVADSIRKQGYFGRPVHVIWHGGEPLATGINHFGRLVAVFDSLLENGLVEHHVQTNATLIDARWCEFFLEKKFVIGISLDGPRKHNLKRVDRSGKEAFDRIVRGAGLLNAHGIPFSVISVVANHNLEDAEELYEAVLSLGCMSLGVNIEEVEGVNAVTDVDDAKVASFWKRLFAAWQSTPSMNVREINRSLNYIAYVLRGDAPRPRPIRKDPFPTVSWKGDVVLFSPELAGYRSERYSDFLAGNVLETDLTTIIQNAPNLEYVKDFIAGLERCQQECKYFNFCGGAHASNRYFEYGSLAITETSHCRRSIQLSMDSVMSSLEEAT